MTSGALQNALPTNATLQTRSGVGVKGVGLLCLFFGGFGGSAANYRNSLLLPGNVEISVCFAFMQLLHMAYGDFPK